MKIFYLYLTLIISCCCLSHNAIAEDTTTLKNNIEIKENNEENIDEMNKNNEQISDTTDNQTNNIDTIPSKPPPTIHKPNNKIGRILAEEIWMEFSTIPTDKYAIQNKNYFTLSELITQTLPAVPLITTLAANHSNFSYMGLNPKHNKLALNNISMSDFWENSNWDAISPEFANSIQIFDGSNAAVIGGSAGVYVNQQASLFNTSKAYSRLWYAQGDNKLIGVDGIFSQNFLPNWNISGGFKRMSSNSYFQNSFFDIWNARLMLTYKQSDNSAFAIIYHFSNNYNGNFGGIYFQDYNTNDNSPNQVRPNFNDFRDRNYKTDYILSHSIISQHADKERDTNWIVNSNIFLTHLENNFFFEKDSLLLKIDTIGKKISTAINYGINTNIKYFITDKIQLLTGADVFSINIPNTLISDNYNGLGYNLFSKASFLFLDDKSLEINFGGRVGQKYDENIWSIGGLIVKTIELPESKMKLFFDGSILKTEPEPIFDFKNEQHLLSILGFDFNNKIVTINSKIFFRKIDDPIILSFDKIGLNTLQAEMSDITSQNIFGMTADVTWRIVSTLETNLLLSNFWDIQNNDASNSKYTFHNLYAALKLQYTYSKSQSILTLGIRAGMYLTDAKLYYNPVFNNYSYSDLNTKFQSDGIAAYLVAKLGNCYIRINFNNILGLNYSYLAYYPLLQQEFNITFTWGFPR